MRKRIYLFTFFVLLASNTFASDVTVEASNNLVNQFNSKHQLNTSIVETKDYLDIDQGFLKEKNCVFDALFDMDSDGQIDRLLALREKHRSYFVYFTSKDEIKFIDFEYPRVCFFIEQSKVFVISKFESDLMGEVRLEEDRLVVDHPLIDGY